MEELIAVQHFDPTSLVRQCKNVLKGSQPKATTDKKAREEENQIISSFKRKIKPKLWEEVRTFVTIKFSVPTSTLSYAHIDKVKKSSGSL